MGIHGRFLSMVRLVAQRGVKVKHIMLVCQSDRRNQNIVRMLKAHLAAMHQLSNSKRNNLCFHCECVTARRRKEMIEDRRWETCYEISKGNVMAFNPVYDTDNVLRTVRFVREDRSTAKRRMKDMNEELLRTRPLELWLRKA